MSTDAEFLGLAIEQARIERDEGGVPIGADLVADGQALGVGRNRRVQDGSAIRHGETDALERAGRQPASVYRRSTMYTTHVVVRHAHRRHPPVRHPARRDGREPHLRGRRGPAAQPRGEVVNLESQECVELRRAFIAQHPQIWNEDIGE